MIDEYGEEIYLDLKEYWNFDLVSFIAGEVFSSIRVILAMLRNLPEGSRYIAAQVADHDPDQDDVTEERDPRDEAVMDHRVWTLDRRLRAMEINAIYTLISVSADWKDGKGPDFPTIGPASWQEPTNQSNELKTNFDVLRKMGWPGG